MRLLQQEIRFSTSPEVLNVVSLSGGKDSTAMLHMLLERGEKITDVVFFDTGWEFPQMYEHLDLIERKTGLKITRLHPKKSFDYLFSEHLVHMLCGGTKKGYAWPGPLSRWCTARKRDTITVYKRGLAYDFDCIGLAVGEEKRIKTAPRLRYPLMEYGITEKEALIYCKKLGYTWGGLYEYFDRVSCFCCPLASRTALLNLKKNFPDVWAKIEEMAARVPGRFYKDKMTFPEYVSNKLTLLVID